MRRNVIRRHLNALLERNDLTREQRNKIIKIASSDGHIDSLAAKIQAKAEESDPGGDHKFNGPIANLLIWIAANPQVLLEIIKLFAI